MRPMLASPGATAGGDEGGADMPTGAGWMHEIKWDGVRLIAEISNGSVVLRSRSGRDVSAGFPELTTLAELTDDAILDGEAIVWRNGLPSFAHVVDRVHIGSSAAGVAAAAQATKDRPVTYAAFDLLRLDHLDITGLALRHRRAALESIWTKGAYRSLATAYDDGVSLLQATREQRLEGVVSKRWDSIYQPGVRSRDWLKFPHRDTLSLVIGGWRHEANSQRLGAVLVGAPSANDPTRLYYRGRVGSGLAGRAGAELARLLAETSTGAEDSPFFHQVPRVDATGTTWVAPRLVVDVAAHNAAALSAAVRVEDREPVADDGAGKPLRLRQPSYQCLRPDLTPEDVAYA
ncbi:MAG: DNA ligase [Ornithinimicrobium sp.]